MAVTPPSPTAWRVVWWFGFVSLAADMVYEGARSVYGPLLAALGSGELERLALDFEDGSLFELRRGQRWRFWRRPLQGLVG